MRTFARTLLLSLLTVPFSFSLAQTTGTITGRTADDNGGPLPGASIEARSDALQGKKTAVTQADGFFRLTLLPPGTYSVTATLQGFARVQKTVLVQLDKSAAVDFRLSPSATAEVVVTAGAPTVDTTSTTLGNNIGQRSIQSLPTGRNYASVVQVVPGTSSDNANSDQTALTVYGSSGAENGYLIDGINTTNVEYGLQGKELNFEFIQEVDVKTGGYEAEHGRATGGIVNVITRSGGNEFHGDAFGYYTDNGLQASNKNVGATLQGATVGFRREDFGADLGGPILKDRLWFFGAYDWVQNTVDNQLTSGPFADSIIPTKSTRNLASAKLSWMAAPGHSVVASYIQDPRSDTGAINDANHTLNGNLLTFLGEQQFGGRDYALRYDGILGPTVLISFQGARHDERNNVGPSTTAGDVIEYIDTRADNFQTGGFGLVQQKSFVRYSAGGSATIFAGNHEIKTGLEWEQDTADVVKRYSGGQQVTIFDNPLNAARPIYQHFYWTIPTATTNPFNAPVSQLNASPKHKILTAYAQDRWTILPNLTLNVGVRWDRQQIIDASGVAQINLNKDFAPRVGAIWTPGADHKTKVFGSFGYYYEQIPMDLVIRSFSFERQPRVNNFSATSVTPDPAADAILGSTSGIFGGFTEPSDPNLRNQYVREFILGGEREVASNVVIGLKYIYRNYGRVIEDFLCADDGTYCIGNPGQGIMQQIFTLDYASTLPAPKPQRIYRGVQLDVSKRFSNNWQMLASYLWSNLSGNYDGEFAPFTNVGPDPNISAAYDYYDFFTNGGSSPKDRAKITNTGQLSNDRTHQVKVSGVWVAPFHLSVGATAFFSTGTPVTRYGFSDAYGRYEFFLTKRGTEGRTPNTYGLDLNLQYPLMVGPVTVNMMAALFGVLNRQQAVLLDQRYNFAEFSNPSYACGSNADPDDEAKCNSRYKQGAVFQPPMGVRFGMRVTF